MLRREVVRRAGEICEYCLIHQDDAKLVHAKGRDERESVRTGLLDLLREVDRDRAAGVVKVGGDYLTSLWDAWILRAPISSISLRRQPQGWWRLRSIFVPFEHLNDG
jgi:hypothetical protein